MSDERPPGWYPDPFGTSPEDQRYWDGETWLAATPPAPEPAQSQPLPQAPAAPAAPAATELPPWASGLPADRVQTPDGAVLATWGRRLLAYIVDAIIVAIVGAIAAWPTGIWDAFVQLSEDLATATTQSDVAGLQASFLEQHAGTLAFSAIISSVVSAAYTIVLTATRGATWGKRLVGIRVRARMEDRNPSWRESAVRWLVHYGPGLLSSVPVISYLAQLFQLIDGLWPIWDLRRQAIHDKAARTNVVRSR